MDLEDPYENRLFQMFKSCDTNNTGFLDDNALRQLCQLLELQDKGSVLIDDLLRTSEKEPLISFELFKAALLNFLGGGLDVNSSSNTSQNHQICFNNNLRTNASTIEQHCQRSLVISDDLAQQYVDSPPESSDREVSPKLVVGGKKYGRRSRPEHSFSNENSPSDSEESETLVGVTTKTSTMVERSSSQTDIQSTRRRRMVNSSGKLKRCVSLPAQRNSQHKVQTSAGNSSIPKSFTKHKISKSDDQKAMMLLKDDVANKPLSSSVESLGHETLSTTIREVWSSYSAEVGSSYLTCTQLRIVCERLGLQATLAERVAFQTFEQLHANHYNQLISVQDFIKLLTGITTTDDDQSAIIKHKVFGSEELTLKETTTPMESLPAQSIIEIWEDSGISNGKNILLALGFDNKEVNLSHLHKVIEEEVRGLEGEQQATLLRGSVSLFVAELTSARQVLRQVHDENVKLRTDNKEANRRVTMLAMEIDERHSALEENAKKEVQELEQRHSTVVRDLTARMANDRDHWNSLVSKLENRIKNFEQDEIRLKTDLELVRRENEELESEQQNLQKQISEVLEQNIKLNRQIADLTESAQNNDSLERRYKDVTDDISGSISAEEEVVQLVEKLASLQLENHQLRDKNDELVVEIENVNIELQRYKADHKKRSSLTVNAAAPQQSESETSLEEIDCSSVSTATKRRGDSPSKTHITGESPRTGKLRKCGTDADSASESGQSEDMVALNAELRQHGLDIEKNEGNVPHVVKTLRRRVEDLESLLKIQSSTDEPITNNCGHDTVIRRCKELETSLEQMQAAYEDCEDYWQSKLEEERIIYEKQRKIFEEDQEESDKKFTELMEKVREYEEQFNKDGRLSPIEEKDILEQQYVELEAELKTEREKSQTIIEAKSEEVQMLQNEIDILRKDIENLHARLGEIVTDACDFSSKAAAAVVSQRDACESKANSPISYLWHQSTIQQPANLMEPLPNAAISNESGMIKNNKLLNRNNLSTTELSTFSTTLTSTSSPTHQSCISPIQKPKSSPSDTDENGAVADCDTTSTVSGKSLGTQSVVSTSCENVEAAEKSKQRITPTSVLDDIKRLKFLENSLKEQIKDLSFQRDGLVMELQQLHEARPVLEKAYARTAHPNLTQRISQLELKNRHLQNVVKQQQQYSESMIQQSWRQYQTEMNDLRSRLDGQVAMITEQSQRLHNADVLVKDLYVENAHLAATVQRLEQQRFRVTMMNQQQQQHMNQIQGLNVIPGMP